MALNLTYSFTGTPVVKGSGWNVIQLEQNIDLGLCYIKVQTISGTKLKIDFSISITSSTGAIKYKSFYFSPSLTADTNFIAQAYDYLKTLPEFAGAVDC